MINFIDLLNWAATIFVWLLAVGIVGNIVMWLLGGFAPPKPKRKQTVWEKQNEEDYEAWKAELKRCLAADLPCPDKVDFMLMRFNQRLDEQRKAAQQTALQPLISP